MFESSSFLAISILALIYYCVSTVQLIRFNFSCVETDSRSYHNEYQIHSSVEYDLGSDHDNMDYEEGSIIYNVLPPIQLICFSYVNGGFSILITLSYKMHKVYTPVLIDYNTSVFILMYCSSVFLIILNFFSFARLSIIGKG